MQDNFINISKVPSLLAKFVFAIACMVFLGWIFDIVFLKSILPTLIGMNPTTAVLFALSSIALFFINEKNNEKIIVLGRYIGLFIAVIALIRFAGIYFNWEVGIDQIIFKSKLQGNRLAPNTALCFLLAGFSLFSIDKRKKKNYVPSQLLAFFTLIISLLALIGYIYAARSLYRFSMYIPMAIHTAITFIILATGILLSRYRTGFVSVFMHKNTGGIIVRRLLPISISMPVIIGLLRLKAQRLNLFDAEFGTALATILIIAVVSSLMWWIARSLNKSEEERKKAEQNLFIARDDLAANEALYRNLIENAGVVMYTASLNGLIIFSSSKAFQLTGYTIKELSGMHFTKFVHPDWVENVKATYKTQLTHAIEETMNEFCICTKTGEIKWVEQSAVLITENDLPVGFQCIVKDITQRKDMEDVVRKYEVELVQNQERLQSILDNATSLIYIKDLQGKYLLANKEFKSFLKLTDEEIIGKTDYEIADIRLANRFKDTDDQVIKTCKPLEIEEEIYMPDGNHNILITKFPLLDTQNNIYGISGIATDITHRVKYQEQLIEAKKIAEDAKKLQEQFLANMSHEIRTPMNGIQGMTDLLLDTQLNEEQYDFAKTIKCSSDNLLVIINDILDFSKIKAGKLTIEKIDFKLTEVVENIKAIFKPRINEKGLSLQITLENNVPLILNGDPYRLNQILINLLGNAIKFTQTGGINIKISTLSQTIDGVVLNFIITDTGIGIPADKIDDIFESFTQASVETSRKYGGTGLGLAITKQLLELQKGKISVESKLDSGTTFIVSIPYGNSKTNTPSFFAGKDIKNYRSLLNGKHFLIAEDNEVNQKVIKHVLQKAGGIVDIANNGLEAISLLKNNKYDLIIMDLQMPEMDGYAATKYIRNVMKLSLPIVAMTASALKGEKSKCIEMGMNDYLSKPFDFSFIYKRISLLLSSNLVNYSAEVFETASNKNLFDLCLLEEMDDVNYTTEILNIFLSNTPKEISELQNAFASNQFNTVYKIAHKLKSSTGLLKANNLLGILNKIEAEAKNENKSDLENLINMAANDYNNIEKPLQEYLNNIQKEILTAV